MSRASFDGTYLYLPLFLSLLGLFFIYSATEGAYATRFVEKQVLALLLGLFLFGLLISLNVNFYQEIAWPLFILGLLFLLLVLAFGKVSGGAQRWFAFSGFTLQPSEFAKLFFLILLSALFARSEGQGKVFLLKSTPPLLMYMGAVLLQPDLGTSLVFLAMWLSLVVASSLSFRHLFFLFLLFFLASPLAFRSLKSYQRERFLVFFHPQADPLGSGYHLIQSKIAIGSGELLGRGLSQGSQSQLHFIPGIHTDFIFSLVGEEMGFVGAAALLSLFFLLGFSILQLCQSIEDLFGKALALQIFTLFLFQVFVNVGMTVGLMPVTGIPLPFISYGGSGLLTSWLAVAILGQISVARRILPHASRGPR